MKYGKKYRVGNYQMIKLSRTLTKRETESLRGWIPEEIRDELPRRGIPYIKVSTISGSWAIEFGVSERMFTALDTANEEELKDKETLAMLSNLFSGMYLDTSMLGDKEYNIAKSEALKALLERKATAKKEESDEEKAADDKILEEIKSDMEKKETMERMAKEMENGGRS